MGFVLFLSRFIYFIFPFLHSGGNGVGRVPFYLALGRGSAVGCFARGCDFDCDCDMVEYGRRGEEFLVVKADFNQS